jgi:ATPase family associated with various cellular activities (AAA)
MKKNGTELWKGANFQPLGDEHVDITAKSIGLLPLVQDLLTKASGHVTEYHEEGAIKEAELADDSTVKAESVAEKMHKHMVTLGGRVIHKYLHDSGDNATYIWPDGVVDLNVTGSYVDITALSQNEEFCRDLKKFFDNHWAPVEKTGQIYAIVRHGMSLTLSSIGNAGIPLEAGNYTKKVMKDYRFVIEDLQSETPSGRITIMRGPAGTGKTHLIRAMLLEVPDAMFVLISPEVVTDLSGPELLPLIMNYRGGTAGPIVLVLEDADHCLVKREAANISLIQGLLNLGDGILGSLLDIRIVATTNADELNLDKAITRPGRLSKMLDVNELDFETVNNIFARLLPDVQVPEILKQDNPHNRLKMTLAEVYALARQSGWKAAVRKVEDEDENENPDWDE